MAVGRRPIFGEQQRFMLFLIAPAALLLLLFQVVPIAIGGTTRITIARVPAETPVAAGDRVRVSAPPGRLHFFDPETESAVVA